MKTQVNYVSTEVTAQCRNCPQVWMTGKNVRRLAQQHVLRNDHVVEIATTERETLAPTHSPT